MKKADLSLENPKVIFLCLIYNSVDNLNKDQSENNNNNEDPNNSKSTTDQQK